MINKVQLSKYLQKNEFRWSRKNIRSSSSAFFFMLKTFIPCLLLSSVSMLKHFIARSLEVWKHWMTPRILSSPSISKGGLWEADHTQGSTRGIRASAKLSLKPSMLSLVDRFSFFWWKNRIYASSIRFGTLPSRINRLNQDVCFALLDFEDPTTI